MDRPLFPSTRSWGVRLAFVTALISGVAVYVNGFGVEALAAEGVGSAGYTTLKNIVAAGLLLGATATASRLRPAEGVELPKRRREQLALLAIGVVGGSVPFLLFFEGLARAGSAQAALLHKTLLVWVAVLAVPLLGERLSSWHVAAIGLLIAGQLLVAGGITDLGLGAGEWMILAATLLWSVEVVLAKWLLPTTTALTVGSARMAIGAVVLVGYGIATGAFTQLGALSASSIGWIAITGVLLFGYVATWYTALARAQAIDVTAVLVVGAVVTALLRSGIDGTALPSPAGLGLVLLGAAAAAAAGRRRVVSPR